MTTITRWDPFADLRGTMERPIKLTFLGAGSATPSSATRVRGKMSPRSMANRRSMENVRKILRACGSDLDKVARVNSYVKNASDLPQYSQLYREYFTPPYPARTTITNCLGKVLFEIDVIAVTQD